MSVETLPPKFRKLTDAYKSNWQFQFLCVSLVVISILFFVSFWWNRYIGLHSGVGCFPYANWLLQDFLPYRDYFQLSGPLAIFRGALAMTLFGKFLIVTKALGVLDRSLLGVLIYAWLSRMFKPSVAVFSAIAATIICSQGFADPLEAYHQLSELFTIASGFALAWAFRYGKQAKTFMVSAFLCGAFAAMTMCTKQSTGALALVAMPLIALIMPGSSRNKVKLSAFLIAYAGGCIFIFSFLTAWLLKLEVLNQFFLQVFVQAPAAKAGHPIDFLTRFIYISKQFELALFAAVIFILIQWKSLASFAVRRRTEFSDNFKLLFGPFLLISLSIAAGIITAFKQPDFSALPVHIIFAVAVSRIVVFFGTICIPAYIFYFLITRFLAGRQVSTRQTDLFIFCAVSMVNLVASALSFPLITEMLVPGLAVVVAATIEKVPKFTYGLNIATWCILIAFATNLRCTIPYGLEEIFEKGGAMANSVSSQPALKGFVLPKQTVDFVDGTADFINTHTISGDTIYLYPECNIMHSLTNRRFPTFGCVHIMDVLNDKFAREEAERLLKNKPAVLVYIPDAKMLEKQEEIWRFGKPSGNRAIIKACETLAREYIPVRTYNLSFDKRIYVYVRPDRQQLVR